MLQGRVALLSRGRRGILRWLLLLFGDVAADQTSGRSAKDGMVTGIMTGDSADYRTLDAAFGIDRNDLRRDGRGCDD